MRGLPTFNLYLLSIHNSFFDIAKNLKILSQPFTSILRIFNIFSLTASYLSIFLW